MILVVFRLILNLLLAHANEHNGDDPPKDTTVRQSEKSIEI